MCRRQLSAEASRIFGNLDRTYHINLLRFYDFVFGLASESEKNLDAKRFAHKLNEARNRLALRSKKQFPICLRRQPYESISLGTQLLS
jgi:hypothetical protein